MDTLPELGLPQPLQLPPPGPEAIGLEPRGSLEQLGALLQAELSLWEAPGLRIERFHVGPPRQLHGLGLTLVDAQRRARVGLTLDPGALALLVPERASDLRSLGEAPSRLDRALCVHHLLELLITHSHARGCPLQLAAREAPPAQHALLLELTQDPEDHAASLSASRGLMELNFGSYALSKLRASLPKSRGRFNHNSASAAFELPEASLDAELELATLRLCYSSYCALGPGDLILLPELQQRSGWLEGPAQLRLGSMSLISASLCADGLRLHPDQPLPPPLEEKRTMSESFLEAVQIDLRVVVATLSLDLSSIAALDQDTLLTLPELKGQSRLMLKDRCLATGHLVELEGGWAMQIDERTTP